MTWRPALAPAFWATLVAAGWSAPRATAQDPPRGTGGVPGNVWHFLSDSTRAAWMRPLASLALPGSGQLMGASERGALYLVVEAFFITRFLALQHDARQGADAYRDLAFKVARRAFTPVQRDTVFDYFEAMGKYIESGPVNTGPGPAFVPPTDEHTFNGWIWLLARLTFFPDPRSPPDTTSPDYLRALNFYRRRAVGPGFRWSWHGAGLEQDLFRQTIRSSDQAYRQAREQLGLLLANHLLSAIDALVASRVAGRGSRRRFSSSVDIGRAPPGVFPPVNLRFQVRF
jgi:hypothetical protein